ncbi:hypothetical protein CALCODRAFT_493802 [Calocera cornea HHB12733]|uniref:Alcohol dehydrogenase-like C-terminal domain-containing protein n=1 Tax=Calocera cornea HHB12733 TaxID=1353952 RepID=A0A165HG03_9BASI|nr:hypothetical protein CALCODRAFT_493802 [Calocera cornea HHB12733]
MASEYNDKHPHGVKILIRMTMSGLIGVDWSDKDQKQFYEVVPGMAARGETKYPLDEVDGLDKVGEAFVTLMKGRNMGKVVVKVAEEECVLDEAERGRHSKDVGLVETKTGRT